LKNLAEGINSRFQQAEERISKLENTKFELTV
jgi:hypothetical protein